MDLLFLLHIVVFIEDIVDFIELVDVIEEYEDTVSFAHTYFIKIET